MVFTLEGILKLAKPLQPKIACSPIEVTVGGIFKLSNPQQP